MLTTTLTDFEIDVECYHNLYKDAHGVRPRHDISDWTAEDFKSAFESLRRICEENAVLEAAAEAEAVIELEATLARFIGYGANDRETAIRWLMDANQTDDPDCVCYHLGLPFGYFSRVVQ